MPRKKKIQSDIIFKQLTLRLMQAGPTPTKELLEGLPISQPAFSKLINKHADQVLTIGRGRHTRYALRRTIEGVITNYQQALPLFQVQQNGALVEIGKLHPTYPKGFYIESASPASRTGAYFDDLPYFFEDLRPAGFLGRLVPKQCPEGLFPTDILQWSQDQTVVYFAKYGWDLPGDLILGSEAAEKYLQSIADPLEAIPVAGRAAAYTQLARAILEQGTAGSSAAGEQPKFLSKKTDGVNTQAVLVKFSPSMNLRAPGSATVTETLDRHAQRLSDLLVCEHLALQVMAQHGQSAARSEIITTSERTFLEVERFDRIFNCNANNTGVMGRRGVLSLKALDLELVGKLENWAVVARELLHQGVITAATYNDIEWLYLFGKNIANSDMHLGNLSFYSSEAGQLRTPLTLAPIYDMLPMAYAPIQGQIVARTFTPARPQPGNLKNWASAVSAAIIFWNRVATNPMISNGFQQIATANRNELTRLQDLWRADFVKS